MSDLLLIIYTVKVQAGSKEADDHFNRLGSRDTLELEEAAIDLCNRLLKNRCQMKDQQQKELYIPEKDQFLMWFRGPWMAKISRFRSFSVNAV